MFKSARSRIAAAALLTLGVATGIEKCHDRDQSGSEKKPASAENQPDAKNIAVLQNTDLTGETKDGKVVATHALVSGYLVDEQGKSIRFYDALEAAFKEAAATLDSRQFDEYGLNIGKAMEESCARNMQGMSMSKDAHVYPALMIEIKDSGQAPLDSDIAEKIKKESRSVDPDAVRLTGTAKNGDEISLYIHIGNNPGIEDELRKIFGETVSAMECAPSGDPALEVSHAFLKRWHDSGHPSLDGTGSYPALDFTMGP
jgi:hypothetical protein